MNYIDDDAFILTSGPPQNGKRERISRVRSRITKKYFQRRNARPSKLLSVAKQDDSLPCLSSVTSVLPPEIPYTLFTADNPMLNPAFLVPETTQRMQKFFYFHMRESIQQHSFIRNMIPWSITYPHFTSAKLLSASGWDDLLEGQLNPWTYRQRLITIKLLHDVLKDDPTTHQGVTIAAVQSLLGFEILMGGGKRYLQLRKFSESIIRQGVQCDADTWVFLTRFFTLLDQTNRLCMASDKTWGSSSSDIPINFHFALPFDLNLFTLGQPYLPRDSYIVYSKLGEFYNTLVVARNSGGFSVTRSTQDYISFLWSYAYQESFVETEQRCASHSTNNNLVIAPITLSILLLTSYLRFGIEPQHCQTLPQMASQLRGLLGRAGSKPEAHLDWMPFPGALIWCYATGIRYADLNDKTWFAMQFLRVSHSWALEKWERTYKSVSLIMCALENIRPIFLKGFQPSSCQHAEETQCVRVSIGP